MGFTKFEATFPALNFPTKVTVSGTLRHAAWSEAQRLWWFAYDNSGVESSKHSGVAATTNYNVSGDAGTEDPSSIVVDALGNAMIGLTGNDAVFEFNVGTDTWTKRALGSIASDSVVGYDPVSGRWCAVTEGSTAAGIRTSTDRSTFSNGTVPTAWGDHTTYPALTRYRIASDGDGRLAVVGQGWAGPGPTGAGLCRAMTSDDGGVTWTDRGTFATTISSPTVGSLIWGPYDGFVYTIGEAGTPKSEVWTSPDGVSWTKAATLTTGCLLRVARFGDIYVGLYSGSPAALVYSTDHCTRWKFSNHALDGTGSGVFAGGGQVVALATDSIWPGPRCGDTGAFA